MCFSATSSFTLSAALVPVGFAAVAIARRGASGWMPMAVYPLAFSVQQAFEGILWLGLEADNATIIALSSRGFLFFSHLFWLAWTPFSAYWLQPAGKRKRLLLLLTIAATLFGLSIALPSLLIDNRLSVAVVQGSIDYRTVLIYEGYVDRQVLHAVYALLVVSALAMSSERLIQYFGAFIVLSLVFTKYVFPLTFISVWCYFAALLSFYMLVAVSLKARDHLPGSARMA
jgi:hypothetical protein